MKKLLFALLPALIFGLISGLMGPAFATEPTSGSSVVDSHASSKTTHSSRDEAVNGIAVTSDVTVLAYIQANGATREQMRGSKITLQRSRTLLTSYRNVAGQEVWHSKTYPAGKVFVKGKDGWYHDPNCWNKVKIKTTKTVPVDRIVRGAVKIVQRFVFKSYNTSIATGHSYALAKAWCQTQYAAAEATSSGEARYRAAASASGKARTWVRARELARQASANLLRLEIGTALEFEMWLKTVAEGKAIANATAKVTCSDTPPPPDEKPPVIVQLREVNDLEISWTTSHCVTVDFPEGHAGTVFWTAQYGSFATPTKQAQDMVQVCNTYKAPDEPGKDTITVTVTDAVTGRSVQATTQPFNIYATSGHPMTLT